MEAELVKAVAAQQPMTRSTNGLTASQELMNHALANQTGFFDEKSAGYRALAAAEQADRAIQFALSIKAMVMDAAETRSKVAKSAIRATAYASEAIASAFKSIPFPFNIAAGAATAAALLALGVKVMGGGGASASMPSRTAPREAERRIATTGPTKGDPRGSPFT